MYHLIMFYYIYLSFYIVWFDNRLDNNDIWCCRTILIIFQVRIVGVLFLLAAPGTPQGSFPLDHFSECSDLKDVEKSRRGCRLDMFKMDDYSNRWLIYGESMVNTGLIYCIWVTNFITTSTNERKPWMMVSKVKDPLLIIILGIILGDFSKRTCKYFA